MVNGQPEMKVIEGLTNLRADAVVIGTHDRSVLSRYDLSVYQLGDHMFNSCLGMFHVSNCLINFF